MPIDKAQLIAERTISQDLLGVIDGRARFKHVECFESEKQLLAAIDDPACCVIIDTDVWRHEAGLCTACGSNCDDGPG